MQGFLGCFVQFLGSVGVLLSFILGSVLNWWQLALAHLCLVEQSAILLILQSSTSVATMISTASQ